MCDLLWQTRVAGKPNSFFRPASFADWCDFWEVPRVDADTFDASYLQTALERGSDETGTFGLRIMWDNMPAMITRLRVLRGGASDTETLNAAFGPCQFIHLSRDDKVAEAVSLAIAEQTGLWHRNADGTDRENFGHSDAPIYDDAHIAHELNGLEAEAAGWADWFAANRIRPHRVTYEALAKAPLAQLAAILSFLGKDPALADTATPGTQKLATQRNRDWAARFRKAHGLPPAAEQA